MQCYQFALLAFVLFIYAAFDPVSGKRYPGGRGYPDGHKLGQSGRHDNSRSGRSKPLRGGQTSDHCGTGRADSALPLMQKPAIKVNSDGVTISGFRILGVGKDTTAKFNYYMQNPTAAAGAASR